MSVEFGRLTPNPPTRRVGRKLGNQPKQLGSAGTIRRCMGLGGQKPGVQRSGPDPEDISIRRNQRRVILSW